MTEKKKKTPPFEKSLSRLEELVEKLESGELTLEESLEAFEEGVKISRECRKYLDQAEKRIEVLMGEIEGEADLSPFDPEEDA